MKQNNLLPKFDFFKEKSEIRCYENSQLIPMNCTALTVKQHLTPVFDKDADFLMTVFIVAD